jgi:hypothetical protein
MRHRTPAALAHLGMHVCWHTVGMQVVLASWMVAGVLSKWGINCILEHSCSELVCSKHEPRGNLV